MEREFSYQTGTFFTRNSRPEEIEANEEAKALILTLI